MLSTPKPATAAAAPPHMHQCHTPPPTPLAMHLEHAAAPSPRNTDTNETAWELPQEASTSSSGTAQTQVQKEAAAAAAYGAGVAAASLPDRSGMFRAGTAAAASQVDPEELLRMLVEAMQNDTQGGMGFWEAARAQRAQGVFDPPFVEDFLTAKAAELAPTDERMARAVRAVQAKLCNPLLRQPAPWEM